MTPVRLDPQGPFMRDPLAPHQMRDRLTRTQDLFILCHLGVPRIERDRWSLTIDGMVERPRTLRFDDLVRYPKTEVATIHQCCGSPLAPFEPRRRVCNVRWSGVRLADVLADCRPRSAAQHIWSYGADSGEFSGVVVDPYLKDLPIARVEDDVLIAYEMNGSALPAEHGFPGPPRCSGFLWNQQRQMAHAESNAASKAGRRIHSRLVGTTTRCWMATGRETGETTPVWSIAPESLIVSPAPHESIELSVEREIWGWAWADGGVRSVHVRAGDAATWRPAELEPPRGREWRRFRCPGRRGSAVQWCWLREPRQWVGWSSRYRGGATQSMRWR